MMKNITLRVNDDFHYSAKTYASNAGTTLQNYMISTVTKDLVDKKAYIKSPNTIAGMLITDLLDGLSDEEMLEVIRRAKKEKQK